MNKNFNVDRRLLGGNTMSHISEERRNEVSKASPPVLQKAVVIDIITAPHLSTIEQKTALRDSVNNPELVEVMPVNSIIAQMVTNEIGTLGGPRTILFPFQSSHLMLPIQPGEIVHVIYSDIVANGTTLGYWMNRQHANRSVEDVNYTHLDRQHNPNNNLDNWTLNSFEDATAEEYTPTFPNGGDIEGNYSLALSNENRKPFETIFTKSSASIMITPEVVPRWNKRPQEFVLQGSNNTLIVLGEDRKGSVLGALTGSINPGNEENPDIKGYSGTIDLVAGRGRYIPSAPNEEPTLTAPRIVVNSRSSSEVDKAPFRSADPINDGRKMDNPREGDPDFLNDAARLYISMQTTGDKNFGVSDIPFPAETLPIIQPESADDSTVNRSYVVGKADHIRMIARRDEEKNIEGTVLLLREGSPTGSLDLGYMFIDKNGIQLEHNKIYLGTASKEDPNENSDIDFNNVDGLYEPWILWTKYKDTVENLQEQIRILRDEHKNAIEELRSTTYKAFENLKNNIISGGTCVPYGPNSALTVAGGQLATDIVDVNLSTKEGLKKAFEDIGDENSGKQKENNDKNVARENHSQKIYGSKGGETE